MFYVQPVARAAAAVKQSTLVIVTYQGLKRTLLFVFIRGKKDTRKEATGITGWVKRSPVVDEICEQYTNSSVYFKFNITGAIFNKSCQKKSLVEISL